MKAAQKFILWGTAVLLLINIISIGLSWWYFGYLDMTIVWEMALVTLPPIVVALGSYYLLAEEFRSGREQEERIERGRGRDTRSYGVAHGTPTH
ncbi:MAG: hypothetical protein HYX74_10645 [Acidobacteria bacterium]|nr:hypothetical protein [Acidobacteriota bacterium]